MKRLWIAFAAVMILSFLVLGWVGTRIYQEMPPIPGAVVTTDDQPLIEKGEITAGQTLAIPADSQLCFDYRAAWNLTFGATIPGAASRSGSSGPFPKRVSSASRAGKTTPGR